MPLQGADHPATNTADSAFQPTGIVDDSGFKKRRTKAGLVDHDATVPTANTLTVTDNPDPLADGLVATIDDQCVGCGNCGVMIHQAGLCPSFFEATIISNPSWLERAISSVRRRVISALQEHEPIQ